MRSKSITNTEDGHHYGHPGAHGYMPTTSCGDDKCNTIYDTASSGIHILPTRARHVFRHVRRTLRQPSFASFLQAVAANVYSNTPNGAFSVGRIGDVHLMLFRIRRKSCASLGQSGSLLSASCSAHPSSRHFARCSQSGDLHSNTKASAVTGHRVVRALDASGHQLVTVVSSDCACTVIHLLVVRPFRA